MDSIQCYTGIKDSNLAIPIAPRPSIQAVTPISAPNSSIAAALTKAPPKICPRPIEKKPGSTPIMNGTPQNGVGTPLVNGQGIIGVYHNGAVRFPQSPYGIHLPNQQYRFAVNGPQSNIYIHL